MDKDADFRLRHEVGDQLGQLEMTTLHRFALGIFFRLYSQLIRALSRHR
jgi:hypothetical protein